MHPGGHSAGQCWSALMEGALMEGAPCVQRMYLQQGLTTQPADRHLLLFHCSPRVVHLY